MRRKGYAEPCWCGATDCARCYPSTWWHDDDCEDMLDCHCLNPGDPADRFVEP